MSAINAKQQLTGSNKQDIITNQFPNKDKGLELKFDSLNMHERIASEFDNISEVNKCNEATVVQLAVANPASNEK